jgi:hypothetical protein
LYIKKKNIDEYLKEIQELKLLYKDLIMGKISIIEYFDILITILFAFTDDVKNNKIFGSSNIDSLKMYTSSVSTLVNNFKKIDSANTEGTQEIENKIKMSYSQIQTKLEECLDFYNSKKPTEILPRSLNNDITIPIEPMKPIVSTQDLDEERTKLDSINEENENTNDLDRVEQEENKKNHDKIDDVKTIPRNIMKSPAQKKVAIVIGIDKYESQDIIPKLYGAENDAESIYNILKNKCGFEIKEGHFLKGKGATYKGITKAISGLLRGREEYDLILFYFSGHGLVDHFGKGYFATYDVDPDDPFVCGIEMEKISEIITSENKADVVFILDCCYAGKIFEGTRSLGSLQNFEKLRTSIENMRKEVSIATNDFSNASRLDLPGRRIILASTDEKTEAHEKKFLNSENEKEEFHGIFSYYLLKALKGEPDEHTKRPITGIIKLREIIQYIKRNMGNGNQSSLIVPFLPEDENIVLALDTNFKDSISKVIIDIKGNIDKNTLNSVFTATQKLIALEQELINVKVENIEIDNLKTKIDEKLKNYGIRFKKQLSEKSFSEKFENDLENIEDGLFNRFQIITNNLKYDYINTSKINNFDVTNLRIFIQYISTSDLAEEERYEEMIRRIRENQDNKKGR